MVRSWCDAYIHGMELMLPRKVMVRSWCVHCVHCILYSRIHLADFMFLLYIAQSRQSSRFFSSRPNWDSPPPPQPQESVSPPTFGLGGGGTLACRSEGHFTELMRWSVKVTLKVIKRRLKVFCWSCDGVPLKLNLKNCRASSLSLRIKWAHSRLSFWMKLNLKNCGASSLSLRIKWAHSRLSFWMIGQYL